MSTDKDKRPVIAIDGPAASGKGTLARHIAQYLNFAHMDTGALYRAVAYETRQAHGNTDNKDDAIQAAQSLANHFLPELLINRELRSDSIGQMASKVAAYPEIRSILLELQKSFAANPPKMFKGAVLDGRDIGTIICPDADAKLYIEASIDVRAKRRTKELQLRGQDVMYEAVLKDMHERDARDSARKTAPMKPAEDALILDTTAMHPDEVFEKALEYIKSHIDL